MNPTESEIRARLRAVPEPCSLLMRAPTNIVDMGLVEAIAISHGTVSVELVLTDASCIHFAAMRAYVRDVLLEVAGVESVEVTASTTELWTPGRVKTPSSRSRVSLRLPVSQGGSRR